MMTGQLRALEQRRANISRILRVRSYGIDNLRAQYSKKIFDTIYKQSEINDAIDFYYRKSVAGENIKNTSNENLEDVFTNLNKRLENIAKTIPDIMKKFLSHGGKRVMNSKGKRLELKQPNYDEVIEKLKEDNLKYIKDLSQENKKKIVSLIGNGIKKGFNQKEIARQITQEIKDITQQRALLIADNESAKAQGLAMESTMKFNGIEKYMWISAADNRTAPLDAALHYQIFKIGERGKINVVDKTGKVHLISKSPKPVIDTHVRCRCIIVAAPAT